MANVGALFKEEIVRLSRKEARAQIAPVHKLASQQRHDIAALKKRVAALERLVAGLQRKASATAKVSAVEESAKPMRFVAKGLKSHRARLGLSAAEYGKLLGVSPQSVYNWEAGESKPREAQVRAIAQLRQIGKREAHKRLNGVD